MHPAVISQFEIDRAIAETPSLRALAPAALSERGAYYASLPNRGGQVLFEACKQIRRAKLGLVRSENPYVD